MKPIFDSPEEFFKVVGAEPVDALEEKKKHYLIPDQVMRRKEEIGKEAFNAGTFLGEETRHGFRPSVALIEHISEQDVRKLSVDKKTAWLFLCGRDIFKRSLKDEEKIPEGYVFIMNERGENIGLGYAKGNLIENVLDRGDFLRRERSS
ncbi:MAG: hypothetical protein ACOC32_03750 [Nanoarchaeota archaeon]